MGIHRLDDSPASKSKAPSRKLKRDKSSTKFSWSSRELNNFCSSSCSIEGSGSNGKLFAEQKEQAVSLRRQPSAKSSPSTATWISHLKQESWAYMRQSAEFEYPNPFVWKVQWNISAVLLSPFLPARQIICWRRSALEQLNVISTRVTVEQSTHWAQHVVQNKILVSPLLQSWITFAWSSALSSPVA